MQNYATLQEVPGEQEESGVLFHVSEPSRARWNHIEDLDSFFARMYRYHQRHGFLCMLVQEVLELTQFVFVVSFTTFLLHCVNYPVLFKDKPVPNGNSTSKVTLSDVMLSGEECSSDFGLWTYLGLIIAVLVWAWRLLRGIYHLVYFWDIKQFYNNALNIPDSELDNLTWNEVQTRVRAVQLDQQMCIHKRELTELDIHHRILRQHNYLIAMTNKQLLPPRVNVPVVGEVIYWTKGLRYNIQLLLFWGPFSPFQNPWHLREEYKKPNMRHELARKLGRCVLWVALANLLLSPLVLLWQILYAFFSNAEMIKREPGSLGMRTWSMYGRLYLRHFNELDHELQARLSRAHRPATRYLSAFSSALASIIARSLAFMVGAVLSVIIFLTIYDEDVLNVEHMITLLTCCGAALAVCRAIIPDETIAWCPESLLANVLCHTHYLPNNWKNQAHTTRVRSEFQQLFQYRIVGLLEELLSPLITPYVLCWHVYPKILDIVDFYRNFTVSVVGVGDVCSFAQMDVRKHGNPDWQEPDATHKAPPPSQNQYTQAEDGKTELSLVHFTLTNPSWKPPLAGQQQFVETIMRESVFQQQQQQRSLHLQQQEASQVLVESYGYGYGGPQTSGDFMLAHDLNDSSIRETMGGGAGFNASNDMSISTMYLHERHHRQTAAGRSNARSMTAVETTPLLPGH